MSLVMVPVVECDGCGRPEWGNPGQSPEGLRAELSNEGWEIEARDRCSTCQQPHAEALREAWADLEGAF